MSKPITYATATILTFEQRLKLVQAEIKVRTNARPANQRNATRARLWCRWINQSFLQDNPQKNRKSTPINCDLYPWRTSRKSTGASV